MTTTNERRENSRLEIDHYEHCKKCGVEFADGPAPNDVVQRCGDCMDEGISGKTVERRENPDMTIMIEIYRPEPGAPPTKFTVQVAYESVTIKAQMTVDRPVEDSIQVYQTWYDDGDEIKSQKFHVDLIEDDRFHNRWSCQRVAEVIADEIADGIVDIDVEDIRAD